jgi:hypothetical protein
MMAKPCRIVVALVAIPFMVALAQPASATVLTPGEVPAVAPDTFSLGADLKSAGSGLLSAGATYTDDIREGNSYGSTDLTYIFVDNPGERTLPLSLPPNYGGMPR